MVRFMEAWMAWTRASPRPPPFLIFLLRRSARRRAKLPICSFFGLYPISTSSSLPSSSESKSSSAKECVVGTRRADRQQRPSKKHVDRLMVLTGLVYDCRWMRRCAIDVYRSTCGRVARKAAIQLYSWLFFFSLNSEPLSQDYTSRRGPRPTRMKCHT